MMLEQKNQYFAKGYFNSQATAFFFYFQYRECRPVKTRNVIYGFNVYLKGL